MKENIMVNNIVVLFGNVLCGLGVHKVFLDRKHIFTTYGAVLNDDKYYCARCWKTLKRETHVQQRKSL